jgi:hypothetical protein
MIATDEELLGQYDAASFELFYDRYFERVLAFFSRRTRDAELAADLTGETFAAALTGRRRYPGTLRWRTRGCSASPITSSPTRSGGAVRTIAHAGGWASSASSSTMTTSRASTASASRTRWPSSCESCPSSSRRRSGRG